MNKPARITSGDIVSPDYDGDGYGWSVAQARLIRERRFDELDLENIAEEIESVGRSEARSVESALRVLLTHVLKWRHQPGRRTRSWALTIASQRLAYHQRMRRNPGLEPRLEEVLADAYARARIEAAKQTDLEVRDLPLDPPTWDTILEESFELPQ